jgi:hypothetical protein
MSLTRHLDRCFSASGSPAIAAQLARGVCARHDDGRNGRLGEWLDTFSESARELFISRVHANVRGVSYNDRFDSFAGQLVTAYRADVYGYTGTDDDYEHGYGDNDCPCIAGRGRGHRPGRHRRRLASLAGRS